MLYNIFCKFYCPDQPGIGRQQLRITGIFHQIYTQKAPIPQLRWLPYYITYFWPSTYCSAIL